MEITITINGKPVQATVDDADVREAMGEKKPEKKTGYERNEGNSYYIVLDHGDVQTSNDELFLDDVRYKVANYYSDFAVAKNNARADKLMRQLRRFAAEHGGCGKPEIATHADSECYTWTICCCAGVLATREILANIGTVNFKDNNMAQKAIDAFRDELTWYFTEYDPMPEGWWDS